MSRLVELYPASWRARYGEEMELLLAERPPTARDVVDLARGAVDARLDPQLLGDPARPATPWTHRLPGLLAIAGGVLWIAGFSIFATGGASDAQGWAAILLMVMSLPGGYLGAYGRQIGRGVGAAILSVVLVYLLPWELKVLPTLVGISIVGGGILALAAIRASIAARSRMLLVAIAVILPCLLAIPTPAHGWRRSASSRASASTIRCPTS